MAAKSRPKKKHPSPKSRIVSYIVLGTVILGGVATAAKNAEELVALGNKYFGTSPLAPLQKARNAPRGMLWSSPEVSLELVQTAPETKQGERLFDLYLRNNSDRDILLSEVKYGPGALYTSAGPHDVSGAVQLSAEYSVTAQSRRGSVALSPPFSLKAGASGAFRIRMVTRKPSEALEFELYAADGARVASVNHMLGE